MTVTEYYVRLVEIYNFNEQNQQNLIWIFREKLKLPQFEWRTTLLLREQMDELASFANRLAVGEPVARVIGDALFYDAKIKVSGDVLIPRVETEWLAKMVVDKAGKKANVLDLCTGSGCIAIAIKLHRPDIKVTAVDVSKSALDLAKLNAFENKVDIEFLESNMFEGLNKKFDVIVSNPPYIPELDRNTLPEAVIKFDPHLALFGGMDGLDFYKIIGAEAGGYLNEGGLLFLEIGEGQSESVREILEENFTGIEVIFDLFKKERYILARRK